MLSVLPPARLCTLYTLPSGATTSTTKSPMYVCVMSTPTCNVAGALPDTPLTVIGLSTVELSRIAKSAGFSKRGPAGGGVPADNVQIAYAMASALRSSAVTLMLLDVSQDAW